MIFDFTTECYRELLEMFLEAGYELTSFERYLQQNGSHRPVVILRHDVDARPPNAQQFARIEAELGVRASYYFRIVKKSFDEDVIARVVNLGHEIGYHYEDLTLCRGDFIRAIRMFRSNLDRFRTLYPIKTVCMHGSPLSKWDNRQLWERFDYRDYGIIGEPYFDVDFREVAYLTDTGRSWNNGSVSVRDKVESGFRHRFHSTFDIVAAGRRRQLPDKIMLNTHPQRWNDVYAKWLLELLVQNQKNIIKTWIVKKRMQA